jgi:hypothetical protein
MDSPAKEVIVSVNPFTIQGIQLIPSVLSNIVDPVAYHFENITLYCIEVIALRIELFVGTHVCVFKLY